MKIKLLTIKALLTADRSWNRVELISFMRCRLDNYEIKN